MFLGLFCEHRSSQVGQDLFTRDGASQRVADIKAQAVFHSDPGIDPLRVKTGRGFRSYA